MKIKYKIWILAMILLISAVLTLLHAQDNTYIWSRAEVDVNYQTLNLSVEFENRALTDLKPDNSYHTNSYEYNITGNFMIYNDKTEQAFPDLNYKILGYITFGYYGIRDNTTYDRVQNRAIQGLNLYYNRLNYRILLEERFKTEYIVYRHRSKLQYQFPIYNQIYGIKSLHLILNNEIYTNQEFQCRENRSYILLKYYYNRHLSIKGGYMYRIMNEDNYKDNEHIIQISLLFTVGEQIHNLCCEYNKY
jgi:hypothetical protein